MRSEGELKMRASLNSVLITTNQTQAFANRKEAFHLRHWDESSCNRTSHN